MARIENNNVKNENLRKKRYLRGYRRHSAKIKRIESELEEIRGMKLYPSIKADGMPHGSGGVGDLSGWAAKLREKEDALYNEGIEQVKTYKDIEYRISQLEDEDERDVLFYRYIKGMEFWDIANVMGFSERQIYRLHGNALVHVSIKK